MFILYLYLYFDTVNKGSEVMETIIYLVALLITLGASIGVKTTYNKYKKVKNKNNLTGFDVARKILDINGLSNVLVLETQGELSDHYDPEKKCVKLSTEIFHDTTVASIAVAAHECGHAIQDKEGYSFLRFRSKLFPVVNLSSKLGYVALIIGLLAGITELLYFGIVCEIVILLFQLVTLPVEFNASNRALDIILKNGMVDTKEKDGAKSMLTAAAMTYVASVISALLQILRLVIIARSNDRR